MALDDVAYAALQRGDDARVKRIFLGPELRLLRRDGAAARSSSPATRRAARRPPRRRSTTRARTRARGLIAVALGAALVIVLLLVTACGHRAPGARGRATRVRRMTDDIFLTLSLLLMGALLARFIAQL